MSDQGWSSNSNHQIFVHSLASGSICSEGPINTAPLNTSGERIRASTAMSPPRECPTMNTGLPGNCPLMYCLSQMVHLIETFHDKKACSLKALLHERHLLFISAAFMFHESAVFKDVTGILRTKLLSSRFCLCWCMRFKNNIINQMDHPVCAP